MFVCFSNLFEHFLRRQFPTGSKIVKFPTEVLSCYLHNVSVAYETKYHLNMSAKQIQICREIKLNMIYVEHIGSSWSYHYIVTVSYMSQKLCITGRLRYVYAIMCNDALVHK